eukprot:TRINITY_DN5764_c0_g1_i1.p1 TRINITY_DN5764_c0_g1~~TRINITY_DN5764_c0_g1_i1.p1  ORF type:complete len:721 (-),score=287.97 TRINITY_DN5764_c0_g1_i1:22-2184(-)
MRSLVLFLFMFSCVSGQTWNGAHNGNWGSGGSWLGGLIPGLLGGLGNTLGATINAVGQPFTVLVNQATTLTSLTIGGIGSLPTLLIDGVVLNVPDLVLNSGNIRIINGGALNCSRGIIVNSTGLVNIDVDVNVVTSLLGNLKVLNGGLSLNGVISLASKIEVGLGAILHLNGSHSLSTCDVTGSGIVQLAGSLLLNGPNPICSIQTSIFQLLGGTISSVTGITKTLQCNQMSLVDNLVNTIDGCLITATDVIVKNGVINCINGGGLNVIGNLVATVTDVAKITGNLAVNGILDVKVGILVLEDILVAADISVDISAKLLLNNANCSRGLFNLNGLLEIQGILNIDAQVEAAVSILGGEIQVLGNILVNSGIFNLKNCTTRGPLSIALGAVVQVESVIWIATDILNAGTLIVDGLLQLPSTCNLLGLPGSSLLNRGVIQAVADVNLLGLFNLNGVVNVSLGNLNLRGSHVITDTCQVLGNLNLIDAVLNLNLGNLDVVGNIAVLGNSTLNSLFNLNAQLEISALGLDIAAGATVTLFNPLSILGNITISDNAVLNSTFDSHCCGRVRCGCLNLLGETSRYVVDILNSVDVALEVSGHVQLGGILDLQLGVEVDVGLDIMRHASVTGSFSQVLVNGTSDPCYNVVYSPTSTKLDRVPSIKTMSSSDAIDSSEATDSSDATQSSVTRSLSSSMEQTGETVQENGVDRIMAQVFTIVALMVFVL